MITTPYDDVFHTLIWDCPELVLPMLNEVFGEHYTGTEKITFFHNEHLMLQPDGGQQKRVSDSTFLVAGRQPKKYHWECQSTGDRRILVRMFEYDTQLSLRDAEIDGNRLRVTFPRSAVLYLRSSKHTSDSLTVEMVTPGGTICYDVQVMKLQAYTLEQMFEKKLYLLLPFYLFLHEHLLEEYEKDEAKCDTLVAIYQDMLDRLKGLYEAGEINGHTQTMLILMMKKVIDALTVEQTHVKGEMNKIMGGYILDHELRQAERKGLIEGRAEGEIRGRMEEIITVICRKLQKNKSPELIANELEKTLEQILPIYEFASAFAPDYDERTVVNAYFKRQDKEVV